MLKGIFPLHKVEVSSEWVLVSLIDKVIQQDFLLSQSINLNKKRENEMEER